MTHILGKKMLCRIIDKNVSKFFINILYLQIYYLLYFVRKLAKLGKKLTRDDIFIISHKKNNKILVKEDIARVIVCIT